MRTLTEVTADITLAQSENADYESVILPLYEERREILSSNRRKAEDEKFSCQVDCPIHLTHTATLFTDGHRYAGIWECPVEGASDSCSHYDTEVVYGEDEDGTKNSAYHCVLCGVQVPGFPVNTEGE